MSRTAESVWENCLSFIQDNITPQAYKTWFEPIKAVKLTDNALSIQLPSKFFYEWLEEHYVKLLKVSLTKELGEKAKLVYVIKMENTYGNKQPFTEKIPSSQRSNVSSQEVDVPLKNKSPELKNPFIIPGIRNVKIDSQLNPNYSFDNFLEGDSNRLARSAGLAVSNRPGGTSFNPLLVFGGVKEHRVHTFQSLDFPVWKKIQTQSGKKSRLSSSLINSKTKYCCQNYIASTVHVNTNTFEHVTSCGGTIASVCCGVESIVWI